VRLAREANILGKLLLIGSVFAACAGPAGAAWAQTSSAAPCPLERYRVPQWAKGRNTFAAELEPDFKVAWQGAETDLGVAILCAGAAAGAPWAEMALGAMVSEGRLGFKKDPVQARAWMERAAARGHAEAQFMLSGMYISGAGGPVKVAAGVDLLRAAAQGGFADAQFSYGSELYLGRYLPRDPNGALLWLRRAAQAGHEGASKILQELARQGVR